jgi:flagellar basal body-associated protein FliL
MGLLAYTKLIFKRPPITESAERERLAKRKAKMEKAPTVPGLVAFEPVTVNIKPVQPKTSGEAVLRYAKIGFALELKDGSKKGEIEELKPVFMDKLMSLLGRKSYSDLTTVQGRFLVRTEIMDAINELIQKSRIDTHKAKQEKEAKAGHGEQAGDAAHEDDEREIAQSREVLVTNVYFTDFIVQ